METVEELKQAWNTQADEHNQWDNLGLDEIVKFAQNRVWERAKVIMTLVLDLPTQ